MGDEETMDMLKEGRLYIGSSDGFMELPIFGSADVAKLEESPISIKPLTAEEERECFPITMKGTGTVTMDEEAAIGISRLLNESDYMVSIKTDGLHLPRKMKKALRNGWLYRRDTKWKRKATRWDERHTIKALGRFTEDEDGVTFTGQKVE